MRGQSLGIHQVFLKPRVGRHVGLGHQVTRVDQMHTVPFIAVLATHAVQIRARALAAPLKGVVVHKLTRHRVVTVAQCFRAEGANHLRMAVVATLAQIHIATCELQRGVRFDAFNRLRGGFLKEQRHNFNQATNGDDQDDQDHHQQAVGFDFFVAEALSRFVVRHGCSPQACAAKTAGMGTGSTRPLSAVMMTFHNMTNVPNR